MRTWLNTEDALTDFNDYAQRIRAVTENVRQNRVINQKIMRESLDQIVSDAEMIAMLAKLLKASYE